MGSENVDFADIVHTVAKEFGAQLHPNQLTLDTPAVKGRSDRVRLEHVVTSLLSDAISYGEGKPIEIVLRSDDERVYVAVTDHGVGPGYGDVRETVRALGGEIWLSSAPGEGSTFSMSLPR
jgi:signal transduction histidine kinase